MKKIDNTKIEKSLFIIKYNQENHFSLSDISEWKEKNYLKILSYNDYINKNGVFSDGVRTF